MATYASYSPSMLSYEQYAQLVEEPEATTGGTGTTEPVIQPGQLSGTPTPAPTQPSQPIAIIPPVIGSEPLAEPVTGLPIGDYDPYAIIKQVQGPLPVAPSDPLGSGPPTLQPQVQFEPVPFEQPKLQTEPATDVATAGAGTIPAWGWMLLIVAGFYFFSRR